MIHDWDFSRNGSFSSENRLGMRALVAAQVIELWERKCDEHSGAKDDAHFIRLLFNQKPLNLPGRATDAPLSLSAFLDDVIGRFALDPKRFELRCAASPDRPIPAVDTSSI
jgi:hypothetical protein